LLRNSLLAIAIVRLALAMPGTAATVPSGTELSIRLTAPLSSATGKLKQPVSAVLIAPVIVDGQIAIPAGVKVTGTLQEVERAVENRNAAMKPVFTTLESGAVRATIAAEIIELENARETVYGAGRIVGAKHNMLRTL